MSANLTLKFKLAEKAYRNARNLKEELRCLETMLIELPKHKGTDRMQADLKSKISKTKKLVAEQAGRKKTGSQVTRFPRQGAGRAVIIGGPNSGKSQLLASLTNAKPEIGDYPFTTRACQVGMMPWNAVFVQLIDTPPITSDLFEPTVQSLVRGCDLILLLLDLGSDDGGDQLIELMQQFENGKTQLANETKLDPDNIGVSLTKTFFLPNKIDLEGAKDRFEFFVEQFSSRLEQQPSEFDSFVISANDPEKLEALRDAVFHALDVVRVYTKHPNRKQPDLDSPFTLPRGGCVGELAE